MAFVCKNVSKINSLLKSTIKHNFKYHDNFMPYLSKDLTSLIHTYSNLQLYALNDNLDVDVHNLQTKILNNIYKKIEPKENFGQDILFALFHSFKNYYINNPSQQYKDILVKVVNIMNDYPELFKHDQLEQVVKTFSSKDFLDIKASLKKNINLFKKKTSKIEQNNILQLLDLNSNKYKISVDVVNQFIVLIDKKHYDKHIIFVELSHCGMESLNLYSSLVKSMNPKYVLVDYEPYTISKGFKDNGKINTNLTEYTRFKDAKEFKDILKLFNNSFTVKTNNIYDLATKQYLEVESIIYSSLLDKREVILFDNSYNTYVKSFVDSLDKASFGDYLNYISTFNILEIVSWIATQEKVGCKNCASFLNRKSINWTPNHPEFLFKSSLPNSNLLLQQKANAIRETIKNSKIEDNIVIFTTKARELAGATINFIEGDESGSRQNDESGSRQNDEIEFNLRDQDPKTVALALLLKQSNVNNMYFNNPPIRLKNVEADDFKRYQVDYKELFEKIYFNNLAKDFDVGEMKSDDKKCEPLEFLNEQLLINKRLI
jgi:hypothetical protein